MEGLEIVELKVSNIKSDNIDFRIDSEYFLKSNLFRLTQLNKVGIKKIGEFCYVTDGIHTSIDYCVKSKINLISATSPRENFFDISRGVFISEESHKKNPRTALKIDDVIISTVGTIGNCAVVSPDILPANSDRHVGIIRCNTNEFYPNYISTFLLSKFGRFQTWRESTGNVQLNLFIYKIKTLKIANLSYKFQGKIDELVRLANFNRKESQTKYSESENYLLENLGLKDFKPSKEKTNIKNYKESFLISGRLDAEYYQPKYEDYLKLICSYSKGHSNIQEICDLKDKNFNPLEKLEYKYIELSNIGKSGEVIGCTNALGYELPSRARRKVYTNDVIISSIEGSLNSCALITEEYNNSICSTGFYVISSDKINSETLLVLFKSEPMQNILKQNCSGTILTAINKDEFLNIPIPIIEEDVQENIRLKVAESFTLRKKSEYLLELAKRAVEIAIEENEEIALKYIEQNNTYI